MGINKARAKSASKSESIHGECEKQQGLIRELRGLLRGYGPPWYTEEIDARLCEALAESSRPEDKTDH
jgi:hypothetical protein